LLARVFDNLFSNLAPNWREAMADRPVLQLRTVESTGGTPAMTEIDFFSPWPQPGVRIAADKLFEPFASGRPGGLGLGLYQARKSLNEAGAKPEPEAGSSCRMPAHAP
jgi:hypothetical protein